MSATKTWRVEAKDPRVLGDLVLHAGGDASAIGEGRVFVNRVRATRTDAAIEIGDIVTIASASEKSGESVTILHHGSDFVAVQKDPGTVTIPDLHGAAQSLLARTARTLGIDAKALHATSRLDREVSGVVVFALAKSASDRLQRARDEHRYARRYVAIASIKPGAALAESGVWNARIGRDGDPKKRKIDGRDATDAESRFAVVERKGAYVLFALAPITGRTHQLRVHASHAGAPLIGDRMYKGPTSITLPGGRVVSLGRIALHAACVTLPVAMEGERDRDVTIRCDVPADLRDLWSALGGSGSAWDTAVNLPMPDASDVDEQARP